jgi:ELWxxDGT repeat protein
MNTESLERRIQFAASPIDLGLSVTGSPDPVASNGAIYANARSSSDNDNELWRSTGTLAGTTQVADLFAGTYGSYPDQLTNVNGVIYFTANDGGGRGIFRSDGTTAGTRLVRRFTESITNLCAVGNTLFFTAGDVGDGYGRELWKTDGTLSGTVRISDTNPGPGGGAMAGFYAWNNKLFFTCNVGNYGSELWVSDGTASGTHMVRDINAGLNNSIPQRFMPFNGKLYFSALEQSTGYEMWVTDGTSAGTKLVKDLAPGTANTIFMPWGTINGAFYFTGTANGPSQNIYRLDTANNITVVKQFTNPSNGSSTAFYAAPIGTSKIFFFARTDTTGVEPWVTDGTSAGTVMLKDVWAGASDGADKLVKPVASSTHVFFVANNGSTGKEIWATDGTSAGTFLHCEAKTGSAGSDPDDLIVAGSNLFFKANYDQYRIEGRLYVVPTPTAPTPPPPPPNNTAGSIRGYSFNDNNVNGVLDSGDSKTGGKTIFLDANNNGKLDSGEKKTTSSSDGSYAFTGLVAGTYYVRRVFPSGYTYSNTPLNIALTRGQNVVDANIGSRSGSSTPPPPPPSGTTGSIRGYTFNDNNVNGVLDSGDSKISGKTVFLDSNNNGKLDSGEKSTKSATDGSYVFSGLTSGTYYVRRVFPSGYTYSNSPLNIALTSGQNVVDANIGSRSTSSPTTPTPPPPTGGTTGSISGVSFNDNNVNGLLV